MKKEHAEAEKHARKATGILLPLEAAHGSDYNFANSLVLAYGSLNMALEGRGKQNEEIEVGLGSVSTDSPLTPEASARWAATGLTGGQLATLRSLTFAVAELGGDTLAIAYDGQLRIVIDDDAAGWGWFVDLTPWDDSEFITPGNQGEQGRMDLLTTLIHEIGHILGHVHEEGVMHETLAAGERHATEPHPNETIDSTFADYAWVAYPLERRNHR